MERWTGKLAGILMMACWMGAMSPAWAVYPPPAKDEGKFFSKEAVEKANKKIRELYEKYKKDVVIETIPSLSTDLEKKLKEQGRDKFWARYALERSRELGVNGIYLVLSKSPQRMQVHMDPDTQKKTFTARDRKALMDAVLSQFKDDRFDAGLEAGLKVIERALEANSK